MGIRTYLLRRKLRRLKAKRDRYLKWADEYRHAAFEKGMQAYYMDQFATPIAWGKTQAAANTCRLYEREFMGLAAEAEQDAKKVEAKILQIEGAV